MFISNINKKRQDLSIKVEQVKLYLYFNISISRLYIINKGF
jgi:hypothetical protein